MEIKLTVSALVADSRQNILLVQEANDGDRFNLPGGGAKGRETLFDAVMRETQEESGLVVRPEYLVGMYQCTRTRAKNNVTRLVVACSVVGGELTPSKPHPIVDFFSDAAIREFHKTGQLQNTGLGQAIKDYRAGKGASRDFLMPVKKHKK